MPYLLSCDIHTHTMFSAHAYSTIEENVSGRQSVVCRCSDLPTI